MQSLFNFEQMKAFVAREDFTMCFDGMHGVSGPYAVKIFGEILGVKAESLYRCDVLPDFG
jgi:phosphoglucomutase